MSDEDDWDFAGADESQMTRQCDICSRAPMPATAATFWLRSSRSCAKPHMTYRLTNPIHSMTRQADRWRRPPVSSGIAGCRCPPVCVGAGQAAAGSPGGHCLKRTRHWRRVPV
jgi:hypothetical protein